MQIVGERLGEGVEQGREVGGWNMCRTREGWMEQSSDMFRNEGKSGQETVAANDKKS